MPCAMGQLTIYLDSKTQKKLEAAAKRKAVSLSGWAREHLAKAADEDLGTAWDHLAAFAGSAGEDFAPPSRMGESRPVPEL